MHSEFYMNDMILTSILNFYKSKQQQQQQPRKQLVNRNNKKLQYNNNNSSNNKTASSSSSSSSLKILKRDKNICFYRVRSNGDILTNDCTQKYNLKTNMYVKKKKKKKKKQGDGHPRHKIDNTNVFGDMRM